MEKVRALRTSSFQPKCFVRYGFTLVELMVTVAVVSLLSTIALSSYTSVMAKSDRAAAISDIVEITQSLERYFSFNRTYTNDFSALSMAPSTAYTLIDKQSLYTYYIITPGTAITPGTSTVASKPSAETEGLSYTVYAEPRSKNRDHWTISINELGFKFHFNTLTASGTDKTATKGWP